MNWLTIVTALIAVGGVWWTAGWRVLVRVIVASLLLAFVFAFAVTHYVPCDGFGQGFRMFYNIECPSSH
jgi:hypothetical protein